MPLSGKLEIKVHASRSTISVIDSYPRAGQLRRLRAILLFSWGVIVWYCGNAAWNIYQLAHANLSQLFSLKNVLNALVLPGPLANPSTPFWVFIAFAIPFLPILFGCIWATGDLRQEHQILQAREIHEEVNEDLQSRGIDKQLSRPLGPPFDLTSLPQAGKLIGRNADIQWLLKRLKAGNMHNVTALYGLVGIGKTALVAEVIGKLYTEKRFKDGIAVIQCQGITRADEILQNIATQFDSHRRSPETKNPLELAKLISRLLMGKNALVVLDNIEPTLAIKDVIMAVRAVRSITILVTSQHKLPQAVVPESSCRTLSLLSQKEALELFAQFLGRNVFTFTDTEYKAAEQIVAKLGYHTLAIKIVGVYAFGCKRDLGTLAEELNDLQRAIKLSDDENKPEAVKLAFANSTQALPFEAKQLFEVLAVFPNNEFSRRAMIALARYINPDTAEVNADILVPRGLVEAFVEEAIPQQSDRERRRLHPLLRAFSEDSFANWSPNERIAVQRTLAVYYADYIKNVNEETLLFDEDNVMGVLDWVSKHNENELLVAFCSVMQFFWFDNWQMEACLHYLPLAIVASNSIAQKSNEPAEFMRVVVMKRLYGQVLQHIGKTSLAKTNFEEALGILNNVGNKQEEAKILVLLGRIELQIGNLEEAERKFRQSLRIYQEVGDQEGGGEVREALGEIAQQRGRLRDAESYYQQSLDILNNINSSSCLIANFIHLGEIALLREDLKKAERYYGKALSEARRNGNPKDEMLIQGYIGILALLKNQLEEAKYYFQKALDVAQEIKHSKGECWVLEQLGNLALKQRHLENARKLYEKALEIAQSIEDVHEEGKIYVCCGRIEQVAENKGMAEVCFRNGLTIAVKTSNIISRAEVALTFGTFLVEQQNNSIDGYPLLKEAVQLYAFMKLPAETNARRTAQRLGMPR